MGLHIFEKNIDVTKISWFWSREQNLQFFRARVKWSLPRTPSLNFVVVLLRSRHSNKDDYAFDPSDRYE